MNWGHCREVSLAYRSSLLIFEGNILRQESMALGLAQARLGCTNVFRRADEGDGFEGMETIYSGVVAEM